MDGFLSNLYMNIVETWKQTNWILVTLTPLSRSHYVSDFRKMACLHPVSWRNGWILTKLAQLYCWHMQMNWLYFGYLDPIFKVTWGLRLLENGLSAPYLLKERMDFDQTCKSILLWYGKELVLLWHGKELNFGELDSIFKVTQGLRLLENGLSAPSHKGMDGFWPNLHSCIVVTWKRND